MSQSEERGLTVLQSHVISRELSTRALVEIRRSLGV